MQDVEAKAGEHAAFGLVSLDPARDSPARLAEFAKQRRLSARWTLLRCDEQAVLGVKYRTVSPTEIVHTSTLTILDADGRMLAQYSETDAVDRAVGALQRFSRWPQITLRAISVSKSGFRRNSLLRATVAALGIGAVASIVSSSALIAQGAASTATPVAFFGELRARTEWDRPGGPLAADVYTYLRTRLGIRATPAAGVRIVFQLQDSRAYGVNISSAANNPDIFDLHQGYVDLSTTWRRADVTTRVGRQEVSFGNERLVGPVAWSNTGRTMDGARVIFAPRGAVAGRERWTATAFAATVDERGRRFATASVPAGASYPADHAVVGAYVTRALAVGAFDGTVLYDAGATYRAFASSDRFTADVRLRSGLAKAFGVELEAGYQGGRQRYQALSAAQDVSAWLMGARAGRFPAAGRKKTGIVGVDMLSGDAKPFDGTYTAFNTMYATNHAFYGLMDLFLDPAARTNDQGLVDALGVMTAELNSRATLRTELHHYAPQAGKTSEIGWELDAIVPIRLSSAATLELGYGAFRAGAGAAAMGLGANGYARQWAYAQLRASF